MAKILEGPITTTQVANFMDNVSKSFIEGLYYNDHLKTKVRFWKPEMIVYPLKYLSNRETEFLTLYQKTYERNHLSKIKSSVAEFAVDINIFYDNGCPTRKVQTRILNKTMLEDLITRQTFEPSKREFLITSYSPFFNSGSYAWDHFRKFLEHRDAMIAQAQERIGASVSKAAYNMINDLHQ